MPAIIGQRSPGEPSPGPAADERYLVPGADLDDRLHLGRGAGQDHRRRQAAQYRQAITLVGLQLIPLDDQTIDPNSGPKFG